MTATAETTTYDGGGQAAGGVHLQGAVPVLGGRGPRRRRDLRLDPGLVRRPRNRAGRRRLRPLPRACRCTSRATCWPGTGRRRCSSTTGAARSSSRRCSTVFTGRLGGAVADLAALIGEVVAVERVPITFDVVDGKGHIRIGDVAEARLAPFLGATGHADHAARHGVLHHPRLARVRRARPRGSAATAAGTGCPTSRSRARTPSRARSGSRPDDDASSSTRVARPPRPGARALGRGGRPAGCCSSGSLLRGPGLAHHHGVLAAARAPAATGHCALPAFAGAWLVMVGGDDAADDRADGADVRRRHRARRATAPGYGRCSWRRTSRSGSASPWSRCSATPRCTHSSTTGRGCATASGWSWPGRSRWPASSSSRPLNRRCLRACRDPRGVPVPALPPRRRRRLAAGRPPRAVLPGLLLGADAGHVRDRRGQPALDGRADRGHGGREDHAAGARSSWHQSVSCCCSRRSGSAWRHWHLRPVSCTSPGAATEYGRTMAGGSSRRPRCSLLVRWSSTTNGLVVGLTLSR